MTTDPPPDYTSDIESEARSHQEILDRDNERSLPTRIALAVMGFMLAVGVCGGDDGDDEMKAQVTVTIRLPQRLEFEWGFVEPFAYRQTFDFVEAGSGYERDVIRNDTEHYARHTMERKVYNELEAQYHHDVAVLCLSRCELEFDWHTDRPRTFQ